LFGKKKPAPRTCPEGHELEPGWEQCPHCTAERKKEKEEATRRTVVVSKPAAPPRSLVGWVVALGGEQRDQDFRLHEGRNVFGKADGCDVPLKDAHVSERHAVLEHRSDTGTWTLEDLESKHGTWVNGARLAGETRRIRDGDRLRLGRTELYFRTFEPPEVERPPS
jgi:hypothetical protein